MGFLITNTSLKLSILKCRVFYFSRIPLPPFACMKPNWLALGKRVTKVIIRWGKKRM